MRPIYKLLSLVFLALPFAANAQDPAWATPGARTTPVAKRTSAADTTFSVYPLDALIDLAQKNNQSLKVSTSSLNISQQASQLIFKGNAINSTIASASLQEQISALNLAEDVLNIKMLVASNYLDLYTLYNQQSVYEQNVKLAQLRFDQIQKLYKAGMVTRNDIIRSELQIANLKLARQVVMNNAGIVKKQLAIATRLPSTIVILPDSTMLGSRPISNSLYHYESEALKNHPAIKAARLNTAVAEKNFQIAKSDLSPSLSLYAGSSLDRPLTSASPAIKHFRFEEID